MFFRICAIIGSIPALGAVLVAQSFPPGYLNPEPIIRAAENAIGTKNLDCVTLSGTAYTGMVGQQRLNGYDIDWPRGERLTEYSRIIYCELGLA